MAEKPLTDLTLTDLFEEYKGRLSEERRPDNMKKAAQYLRFFYRCVSIPLDVI